MEGKKYQHEWTGSLGRRFRVEDVVSGYPRVQFTRGDDAWCNCTSDWGVSELMQEVLRLSAALARALAGEEEKDA